MAAFNLRSTHTMDDFASIINDQLKQLKEAVRKRGRVNLLVAGKTGVGKSTLINAVFQGNFASTGQGRPATKNTRKIKKKGVPLYVYDTRGLELERFPESLEELEELICGLSQSEDPNDHIHCAWLCISEDGRRVEEAEIKLLNLLAKHIPVAVVITKSRADAGFRAEVQRLLPKASNVIRVRAISELQDDGHVLAPMSLIDLVEWTMQVIPEGQKNAFAAAQKVTVQLKQERAHLIVASASTAAAGIGAIPIPFADAYLLVPIQISMLASITASFGLSIDKGFFATFVSATLAGTGGTMLGRSVLAAFLFLVPGAGPFLNGVISGVIAAVFTTAIGEAHIAAVSHLIRNNPSKTPTAEEIASRLKEEMAKRNPFAKDKRKRELNYEPALLLGR
jgi:uncharacterized protein (DUF697 family)/GTP-binding protein EngB required for normal cell division